MAIKVVQDEEEPIPVEVLATSIKHIGDAVRKMDASCLNEKTIVLLLSKASGESQRTVRNVMFGMRNLEKKYLKRGTNGRN